MGCLGDSSVCLGEQMIRTLQDLKQTGRPRPLSAPCAGSFPVPPLCQRRSRPSRESRLTRLRVSSSSEASAYDSACCLAGPLEEEEEEEEEEEAAAAAAEAREGRLGPGSPSSRKSLDLDSGYSEASWQDEGVVLRRTRNVRVSASACLRTNRGASGRPRPKSTSDACLERWTSFEACGGGGGGGGGGGSTEDWTAALLSRSRNRTPLVLGDNSFADLIKNWMDLPECPEPAELQPSAGRRLAKDLLGNMRRKLAGRAKGGVEVRRRPADPNRASRPLEAPKRMSCPVGFQALKPFFHQSHTGIHQLDSDFYQFNALMKTGSRQPIICNDIIGYI